MNYLVTGYRPLNGEIVNMPKVIVSAESAEEAVMQAAGVPYFTALTKRFQFRECSEMVKDNAHLQVDSSGQIGWYAERVEAVAIIAKLEAKLNQIYGAVKDLYEREAEFLAFAAQICGDHEIVK